MEQSNTNKQGILLHPVVSIGVISLFLWLAFIHGQLFMEGGHYRHLLFFIAAIVIIINRILWLPRITVFVESKNSYKIARQSLPLVVLVLIGAFIVL